MLVAVAQNLPPVNPGKTAQRLGKTEKRRGDKKKKLKIIIIASITLITAAPQNFKDNKLSVHFSV